MIPSVLRLKRQVCVRREYNLTGGPSSPLLAGSISRLKREKYASQERIIEQESFKDYSWLSYSPVRKELLLRMINDKMKLNRSENEWCWARSLPRRDLVPSHSLINKQKINSLEQERVIHKYHLKILFSYQSIICIWNFLGILFIFVIMNRKKNISK